MRLLFEMVPDEKLAGPVYTRPSVRGIILKGECVAMVHSLVYDYYKFPGGGIEGDEDQLTTLYREVAEEAGLKVIEGSAKPYGHVYRVEKSDQGGIFVQDNYYYLCQVADQCIHQQLDDYEAEEQFTLEWVAWREAVRVNRQSDHGPKNQNMLEREARVLEYLHAEGYLS